MCLYQLRRVYELIRVLCALGLLYKHYKVYTTYYTLIRVYLTYIHAFEYIHA